MSDQHAIISTIGSVGEHFSDHLDLLSTMSRDFTQSRDVTQSLSRALVRICNYLDAEGGALFLLDGTGENLTCEACFGPVDITGLTLPSGEGIVGRSVNGGHGEIVRDVSKDPNFKGAVDAKTGFTTRSVLCAPMGNKEERIGAIEVLNKRSGEGLFSESDLNMLMALSASAGLAVTNARMAEELVEQEKVQRELELAAEIQRYLLPDPAAPTYPVHGLNFPARMVSGDLYDFFTLDDGRICFSLGDVSGKGMAAALTMTKASSLFRCLGKTMLDPGRLLGAINREICETATQGKFVTMVAGILEPWSGLVRLANAGHEPPLLRQKDGTYRTFPADAPPLGIAPDIVENDRFPVDEFHLDGGELYIFTDGLTEGFKEDGSELGIEGVTALINAHVARPMQNRLEALIEPIKSEGKALRDDLTILAVQDLRPIKGRDLTDHDRVDGGLPPTIDDGANGWLVNLRFPSRAGMLKLVRQTTINVAGQLGCSERITQDVVIAVDEACQNIIRHAYKGAEGPVEFAIRESQGNMILKLRDFAPTVDATKIKPRNLDDIRPGGLGTHFIQEVMDRVDYLPPPDGERGNILRLVKRIA